MGADYDFFLAHSSAEAETAVAVRLYECLSKRGARVFLDVESVQPGDRWDVVIADALGRSRVVVVLIGETAQKAHYLLDEIQTAIQRSRDRHCSVVPVLVDGAVLGSSNLPYGLKRFQALDLAKLGVDGVAEKLLKVLAGKPRAPTGAPPAVAPTPREPRIDPVESARAEQPPPRVSTTAPRAVQKTPALGAPSARTDSRALTWVHLSDIHIGHGDAGHRANQAQILARLLDDAREMRTKLGAPDLVLVTGDIAYSGKQHQYGPTKVRSDQTAAEWLTTFCAAVGAGSGALAVVPGNHDVDRDAVSPGSRLHHDLFRGPRGIDALDTLLNSRKDAKDLLAKLKAYDVFASALRSGPGAPQRPWWTREVSTRLGSVLLVGLNTALASLDDSDPGRLALGQRQLGDGLASATPERLTLVLMHHPPEDLQDGGQLLARLGNLPSVLLSGHVHQLGATASRALGTSGLLRMSAGAVHAEKKEGPQHTYSWSRLTPEGLTYYPRAWSKNFGKFVADHVPQGSGTIVETREQLPQQLQAWLPPIVATVLTNPLRDVGPDPVEAENPYPRGSLPAALFVAFQLDRKEQWHSLVEAYDHRHAVLLLAGHEHSSLLLFIDRARHDLGRHGGRATKVLHVEFRSHGRDAGMGSADAWMRAAAETTGIRAADVPAALRAVARQQDVLLVLGPIPQAHLERDAITGLDEFLTRSLPSFLEGERRGGHAHGFRVLVLVNDDQPVDAEANPPVLRQLETVARRGFGEPGAVIPMPRARNPEWHRDIEPVLARFDVSEGTRARVKAHYEKHIGSVFTFAEFGALLETCLKEATRPKEARP